MRRQFLLFTVSGTLAFLIDAGLVQTLVRLFGADPYLARVVSVAGAVLFTFSFNRQLTFAAQRREADSALHHVFVRYLIAQSGGFALNYAVYALLIHLLPLSREWPSLAVAAGSIAGLFANFFSARRWVFRAG